MIHRCFIYIRWKVSCHFFSRDRRTVILAFRIWTRLANVNIWVYASSYHETAKFPKSTPNIYLSFLAYNQVYNLFVCTLCPCLTSFLQWNWDKPQQNSRSLDMSRVTWKSRFRLSLTNSRGSRVAGPKSRSRVNCRGRGSIVAVAGPMSR